MNILEVKRDEMTRIIEFYRFIEEYGHIYYLGSELLDKSFKKIMEGIDEIEKFINESYEM